MSLLAHFLDLAELSQQLLRFLLLFALGVDHVHCGVEVVLDLSHLLGDHRLHVGILTRQSLSGTLVDLSHDLVEDLGLELVLQMPVDCVEARQPLELLAHCTSRISLEPLLEVSLGLLCGVLNLLDAREGPIPDGLLVLELPRVVEVLLQGAVELYGSLDVRVVEDLVGEGLMIDEDGLGAVLLARDRVAPILQSEALGPDLALF